MDIKSVVAASGLAAVPVSVGFAVLVVGALKGVVG